MMRFIYTFLIIVISCSCVKDKDENPIPEPTKYNDVTFSGVVQDCFTNKPIKGALVTMNYCIWVSDCPYSWCGGQNNCSSSSYYYVDTLGRFSITSRNVEGTLYLLSAWADNYSSPCGCGDNILTLVSTDNNIIFKLSTFQDYPRYIALNFRFTNGYSPDNYIIYGIWNKIYPPFDPWRYLIYRDTVIFEEILIGYKYGIKALAYENLVLTASLEDSIFWTPYKDTLSYILEYDNKEDTLLFQKMENY